MPNARSAKPVSCRPIDRWERAKECNASCAELMPGVVQRRHVGRFADAFPSMAATRTAAFRSGGTIRPSGTRSRDDEKRTPLKETHAQGENTSPDVSGALDCRLFHGPSD